MKADVSRLTVAAVFALWVLVGLVLAVVVMAA